MRGKKTGALLVALAVAVLLSSCGEKETGSVLSAYDYGYQAGEADEIAFEKPGRIFGAFAAMCCFLHRRRLPP